MLVELKDKLEKENYATAVAGFPTGIPGVLTDAREALRGLGFAPLEVENLLQEALKEKGPDAGSGVLVKYVLQRVGGKEGK
jgi:Holliday junction resolvasome RuvABC DNA-binding subunit